MHFADRQVYVHGLDDIVGRPLLNMAQEFQREMRWALPSLSPSPSLCASTIPPHHGRAAHKPCSHPRPYRPWIKSRWADWKGVEYTLADEYEYVCGPAAPKTCTPGERDTGNVGKTPADFLALANERIRTRRLGLPPERRLPEQHAFLSLEEVSQSELQPNPHHF